MRRPIGPRLHGALDYGLLVLNLAVPRLPRLLLRARVVFGSFGLAQGGLNAPTDQPLAPVHAIPFATHGAIERNSLPIFVGVPLVTGVLSARRTLGRFLVAGATLVAVPDRLAGDTVTIEPRRGRRG